MKVHCLPTYLYDQWFEIHHEIDSQRDNKLIYFIEIDILLQSYYSIICYYSMITIAAEMLNV